MKSHPMGASGGFHPGVARSCASGRVRLLLLLALAVLASVSINVASAAAAELKITSIHDIDYSSAKMDFRIREGGGYLNREVSSDNVNWKVFSGELLFAGEEPVGADNVPIEELKAGRTYFVRLNLVDFGAGTEEFSPTVEFTTLGPVPPPMASINPVADITSTTAHFSGEIDPGVANTNPAFNVRWRFECVPACLNSESGEFKDDGVKHAVDQSAELEAGKDYVVKLIAENAGDETVAETEFHTPASAPTVEAFPAFAYGPGTDAVIAGKVRPENQASEYWFEYGRKGDGYTSKTPAVAAGSDSQLTLHTEHISGLLPSTTYQFRIVAKNPTGETKGEEQDFDSLPAPSGVQAGCSNEKIRSETSSEQLDECRAYEVVSPAKKNGGETKATLAVSPDGERVGYYATSSFAGSPSAPLINSYLAIRTPDGWENRAMNPPVEAEGLATNMGFGVVAFNRGLTLALNFPHTVGAQPNVENIVAVGADGSRTLMSGPTFEGATPPDHKCYVGASADMSRVFFSSAEPFEPGVTGIQLWEWHGGEIHLASVLPNGQPPASAVAGSSNVDANQWCLFGTGRGFLYQATAVSEDGSRIFWSEPEAFGSHGLYVRENGTETKVILPPTDHAVFLGAAADGSSVVFRSSEELTGDSTVGGGIYRYDLESEELSFISSGASSKAGARVDGSYGAIVSADASHVYFVARSRLDGSRGVPGGRNLYVAGQNGPEFIATLSDTDGVSSVASPTAWRKETPDGRFFFFESHGRLTAFDNVGHEEIYRYDGTTHVLTCVSCGLADAPADGDARMHPLEESEGSLTFGEHAVVSADGNRVLFQTTAALRPADVNGLMDVYLWNAGRVSLISTGTSTYPSELSGLSPDGRDATFLTRDSLVGQDSDGGAKDVYDARVDGGYPAPVPPSLCETAEACQRAPAPSPTFSPPATGSPGLGNPKHSGKPACKKRKAFKKGKKKCGSKSSGKKKGHRNSSSNRRGK